MIAEAIVLCFWSLQKMEWSVVNEWIKKNKKIKKHKLKKIKEYLSLNTLCPKPVLLE